MSGAFVLALVNDLERESIPRNYLRNRLSAYDIHDVRFIKMFRLDKSSALLVCEKIKDFLQPSRIPANLRVLVALRFFATGSYQSSVANDVYLSLSQQTVSRCIRDVSTAISNHLVKEYVKFPRNEELARIKEKFFNRTRFPGVIGAIDCTHVAVVTPPSSDTSAHSYINRKGFTSLNVQLIVDPDLQILSANANYPGSVHDAFIWRSSLVRDYVSQIRNGWLLGDAGYPLEPWLMTPFPNTAPGTIEENYNAKHASARSCVERCNGVLKARFRCLLKDRVLHYAPQTAGQIIIACVVLHNICISRNIELDDSEMSVLCEDDLIISSDLHTMDVSNRARDIRYRLALSLAA